eukprot:496602-Rhodomonas_salina.1
MAQQTRRYCAPLSSHAAKSKTPAHLSSTICTRIAFDLATYAMSGTDVASGLSAYARATQCPVLT